jgi:hypothetical protein
MPPGGRRGAKQRPKWTREPQLGDLVLAKIKGYPPWPAKVRFHLPAPLLSIATAAHTATLGFHSLPTSSLLCLLASLQLMLYIPCLRRSAGPRTGSISQRPKSFSSTSTALKRCKHFAPPLLRYRYFPLYVYIATTILVTHQLIPY